MVYDMGIGHSPSLPTMDRLLEEFIRATLRYKSSQLHMFKDDANEYASRLINKYGVDPQVLNDLHAGINS